LSKFRSSINEWYIDAEPVGKPLRGLDGAGLERAASLRHQPAARSG
jgi:hypothetical protein